MRALVTGASGQLGRELVARLRGELAWAGGRDALDVADERAVEELVARTAPDVVFNASAWNRVDAAESQPEQAFAVNALGPRALARAARAAGALVVHVSTDYVFDGDSRRPYREDDPPNPLSVYGASKLAGERHVLDSGADALVVRTSGVLGGSGSAQKGGSFVDRILAQARAGKPLRVVADQVFAPTLAGDLAQALLALVRARARGLCHVTNAGSCSWHELATLALAAAGLSVAVEAIAAKDLALAARRPAYSVLDTSRYRALGLPPLRDFREALTELV